MAAVQAGRPVFCEKLLSLDRVTTVATIEAAEAAGVPLQVGFHRRFDPDWAAAAARIQAGELGEVTFFRTSLRDMTPPDPNFLSGSGGFFVDVTVPYPLARDFEERYPAAYAAELDGFARCVRDGTPPRCTGRDALAAFDLALAATESWRTGTTVTLLKENA